MNSPCIARFPAAFGSRASTAVLSLLAAWPTLSLLGCAGPAAQLSQCQQEKDQLLATIRQQRDQVRAADARTASLEARLDDVEKQFALSGRPLRTASSTSGQGALAAPATGQAPASTASAPPERAAEPLPWRAHRVGAAGNDHSLAEELARRDRRVRWDDEFQTGVWNREIDFEPKAAVLSAEGRRALDELASLLKDRTASELRVLVAGAAEDVPRTAGAKGAVGRNLALQRAQAVADYLDRHGVAGERLAVSAAGSLPRGDQGLASDGVDILLIDPHTPVVGWRPPASLLR